MPEETAKPESLMKQWTELLKAIAFIIATLTVAFVAVYMIVFKGDSLQIEYNEHGATVLMRGNDPEKAMILLSASQLWMDTGVNIKPERILRFSASGQVNLAMHRQNQYSMIHERPRITWCGPDGIPLDTNQNEVDAARHQLM